MQVHRFVNKAANQLPHSPAAAGTRTPPWNNTRHRVIEFCFGRLFSAMESRLCAPGGLPTHGIHRVLVCRPNHRLGNAVLLSPLLTEIETLYPGAEIDILAAGHAAEALFSDRFQVRRVFSLPRKIAHHVWATASLLRELRRNRYDLAIDACNDSQSGRLLLMFVRARFKLGFAHQHGRAANECAAAPAEGHSYPEHFARRGVFLLRTAYAAKIARPYPPINLQLSALERQRACQALSAVLAKPGSSLTLERVIGVFANATGAKGYSERWWIQFVGALQTLQPQTTFVNLIAEHGRSQLGGRYASYYTRHLRHLAAVIANMDGFISADCGVMHVAAASGTPTLGLFCATSPAKYGPQGAANVALHTDALDATDVASIASDWLSLAPAPLLTPSARDQIPTPAVAHRNAV